MNNFIKNTTVWLVIILMSFSAVAPSAVSAAAKKEREADSFALYLVNDKKYLNSKNVHKVLTISSVAKLFTTDWALHKLTPNFKFQVNAYLTPYFEKSGYWNVHLSSDYYPYFDQAMANRIIADLKNKGIKNIQNLSFDEGVKFLPNPDADKPKMGDLELDYPNRDTVQANLSSGFRGRGINIENVSYWPSRRESQLMGYRPDQNKTKVEFFYSPKLVDILHRMNSNSNNHVANQIFNKLGGQKAYVQYASKKFTFNIGQHVMFNGSGNPVIIDGKKQYGRSTSSMVVQCLVSINNYMKFYGGISHVLALATPKEKSTLSGYLLRVPELKNKMIAKTGTTWDAITLGGILSTKMGPMIFYINVDVNAKVDINSKEQAKPLQTAARIYISDLLKDIMVRVGPGPDFK